MPKMKTHKGMRKRMRVTKTGKVLRRRPGKSHLMTTKTGKRRGHLRDVMQVKGRQARKVREMLGS